ncbi:hypothetical protein BT96DRAFT_84480 [Gymnopus androsaceus JB14]|uniref:Uncharacterized protein n=1 Tax=Gymnopus androsaceus JB14 TaxID=1447944 RepID=A0A6A4ICR6_9AGAR|nr:hypothetical protein BT96DRAFT_84480 [Gymnopus androsaceus JB14]
MASLNSVNPFLKYQEVEAYMICVYKSEGLNPDMQGYAVRISNFVVNACLALIIRYSEESVLDSVSVILLQVYTLLVCAFITMIRKQLSVADAHFAITSTVTPLSVYFLYASFRKIRKKPSYLFRRLGNQPTTTYAVLSLAMLPMWIVMDGLIYFSNDFASSDCPHISFVSWIMYRMAASILTFYPSVSFIAILFIVWAVYLLRHIRDIRDEYRRRKMNAQGPFGSFRSSVLHTGSGNRMTVR